MIRVQWPDVAISTIHPRDIADVAVRAFTGEHANTAYRLTGPVALTPGEQVEIVGQAIGRPLRAQGLSRAETHDELYAAMPEKYASAMESFYGDGVIDETTVNNTVETVTGHAPRTLQDWVQENAALFS